MNEPSAKIPYEVVVDPDHKFEKLLGLYYFAPTAVDKADVDEEEFPERFLTFTADKGDVRYFATALYEVYDSTNHGGMYIALGNGVAWGIVEINFSEVFSDIIEVSAKNEVEAADKIGEILDLPNFDIFEPISFGKVAVPRIS